MKIRPLYTPYAPTTVEDKPMTPEEIENIKLNIASIREKADIAAARRRRKMSIKDLNDMLLKGWFSISVVDSVHLMYRNSYKEKLTDNETYKVLYMLHVVDYDEMDKDTRNSIPFLIREVLKDCFPLEISKTKRGSYGIPLFEVDEEPPVTGTDLTDEFGKKELQGPFGKALVTSAALLEKLQQAAGEQSDKKSGLHLSYFPEKKPRRGFMEWLKSWVNFS